MKTFKIYTLAVFLTLFFVLPLAAQENTPDEPSLDEEAWATYQATIEESLQWKTGTQILADEKVELNLPENLRFLDSQDGQKVLTQLWGNPESPDVLGVIFPVDCSPSQLNCWGAVLTYESDGHIDDEDAADIDYNDLLEDMQESAKETNKERVKLGYETIEIKGWAVPPYYDSATKKLHWAKEISFMGSNENTLNYNLRILGREGVFVLNVVSGMSQLAAVQEAVSELTDITHFTEGNLYSDYNSATDHLAEYGIAALIGGKLLAKGGLLKGLIALLIAGKKFIIVGGIAIAAFFRKFFKGNNA